MASVSAKRPKSRLRRLRPTGGTRGSSLSALPVRPSASPEDLADALAFALRSEGRERRHDSGEILATIVGAPRRASRARGFVVMKKPPRGGAGARLRVAIGGRRGEMWRIPHHPRPQKSKNLPRHRRIPWLCSAPSRKRSQPGGVNARQSPTCRGSATTILRDFGIGRCETARVSRSRATPARGRSFAAPRLGESSASPYQGGGWSCVPVTNLSARPIGAATSFCDSGVIPPRGRLLPRADPN